MNLKFDSKNPYRNLAKNLRKMVLAKTDVEQELKTLEKYAKTQCSSVFLLSHPSIKFFDVDVNGMSDEEDHFDFSLNPWEQLRTEFLHAMTVRDRRERDVAISKAVSWFYSIERSGDWVKN